MPVLLRQSPWADHRDRRRAIPAAGVRCAHLCGSARRTRRAWRSNQRPNPGAGARYACRAWMVPLSDASFTYTAAVERYPTGAGIGKSSARIYRIPLTTWDGCLPPVSATARPSGRKAARLPITAVDEPAPPEMPAEPAVSRADRWTPTASTESCRSHARRSAGGSAPAGPQAIRRPASSGGRHCRTAPRPSPDTRSAPWGTGRLPAGEDVLEDALQVRRLADEVLCLNAGDLHPADKRGATDCAEAAAEAAHPASAERHTSSATPR